LKGLAGGPLSLAALGGLPAPVRPRHDPREGRVGIVHLGIGNFHRAHQAVYADDALAAGERDWAICGINLRSRDIVDRLNAQDGLYTLLVRGAGEGDDASGTRARVIGSMREAIAFAAEPKRAAARLADPAVRIVTLTITEKGYADGDGSAIALLLDGFAARIAAGAGPLTLLSCDNLSGNGDTLRRVLSQAAARRGDAALAGFVAERIECPNTMVDRIVPATGQADIDEARALTGFADACPVATEPFTQWVIEDRFAAGRPDWARDGVQFVRDVAPFEAMKLRLLNAAHSALACLGVPAGLETVDRAIADPALRGFVERMWREDLAPGLPAEVRDAVPGYCRALLARFANPALGHRLRQIAMDGSQKIPMRWLPAVRAALAQGAMPDALAAAVAGWIRFLGGRGEGGEAWTIDDPLAAALAQRLAEADRAPAAARGSTADPLATDPLAVLDRRADAVLGFEPVFGDLAGHPGLAARVKHWHRRLHAEGTRGALA
jgi:fructuronate reductase